MQLGGCSLKTAKTIPPVKTPFIGSGPMQRVQAIDVLPYFTPSMGWETDQPGTPGRRFRSSSSLSDSDNRN